MKPDALYTLQGTDEFRENTLTLHADLTRAQDANLALNLRISGMEERR